MVLKYCLLIDYIIIANVIVMLMNIKNTTFIKNQFI
ncbi:hypothetical protein J2W48_000149 [Flavobacterium piscis]|uniref:Uncharacterized protein n=1 Tax=Flavobacterium piscis TaxID=1114874 RepID=A0ABU1Y245_9FLAO|nr:hypothetical protein [Flavobacterium piscis]